MDARDRKIAILVVAIGILVQLPGLVWGVTDGKATNNALRILDGDVPYRDFWTMYAPGHFYLAALLFKLFGVHIWVAGIARLTLVAINASLLFVITRRIGLERRPASLVAASFILMKWAFGPSLSSYESVLPFVLTAIERAIAYAQTGRTSALVVAGLLCGVGAWFKHDVSFYVTVGIVAGLSLSWLLLHGRRPDYWVSPIAMATRVGGSALVGVLPAVVFLAVVAGPDAYRDLIEFPATDFRVVRGEPYPPLIPRWDRVSPMFAIPPTPIGAYRSVEYLAEWLQANAPQLVFIVGVAALLRYRRTLSPAAVASTAIALSAMPLFWASAQVQQNTNFSTMWILSILLAATAATAVGQSAWRRAIGISFAVYTAAFILGTLLGMAEVAYLWRGHATLQFPAVAGVRIPQHRYQILQPIISFIRENVPPSEAIYSGLVRHDAVVISNQNFYFMSGRRVASRYNELHPGIVDREEVQREIIGDLERLGVRCAVLWDFGWPKPLMEDILAYRRQYLPEIGSTLLDRYLAEHFQEVARFGEFILVWRKDVPMPPAPAPVPTDPGGAP